MLYYRLSFSFELKRYFFPFEKSENPFFFFFLEKFGREAFGEVSPEKLKGEPATINWGNKFDR